MAAASNTSPQSEYIQHHLVHMNNIGEKQSVIANFDVVNFDSLFWSILMGLIVVYTLWRAAKSVTAGVPGRFQTRSEEHTSGTPVTNAHLVCRLLLEKKKQQI